MILIGDSRQRLAELPDASVHCCVTSPPYFGLRDYGHDGQMGLEPTADEFVAGMVDLFREVRRVLRDDGTLWLNLGDSYTRTGGTDRKISSTGKAGNTLRTLDHIPNRDQKAPAHLGDKQLLGIPWRVAFALQADGWVLRQDIIWHKPNPMPESVRDRCTKAHEYIFLLSKGPRYYFDSEAIKEPLAASSIARLAQDVENQEGSDRVPGKTNGKMKAVRFGGNKYGDDDSELNRTKSGNEWENASGKRNKRSVWTVTTKPFKGAHFATFPSDLIEPCVLAGAPEHCCSVCGAPHVAIVECTQVEDTSYKGSTFDKGKTGARDGGDRTQEGPRYLKQVVGSQPSCKCNARTVGGTVLDPFFGAGTTGLVAERHGRKWIGCELNPTYAQMAEERIAKERNARIEALLG